MTNFFTGFEKKALLGRTMEDIVAGSTAVMPGIAGIGATGLHVATADRPEGHSRVGEFLSRSILPAAAGHGLASIAAKAKGKSSVVRGAAAVGRVLGGVAGSRLSTGSYYRERQQ